MWWLGEKGRMKSVLNQRGIVGLGEVEERQKFVSAVLKGLSENGNDWEEDSCHLNLVL